MHPAQVLRKQVFAVEVIVAVEGRFDGAGGRRCTAMVMMMLRVAVTGMRDTGANVAAVNPEAEVLRRDMTLPLILAGEGGSTAVTAESTYKGPGVRG